jgi:hypothetical protein
MQRISRRWRILRQLAEFTDNTVVYQIAASNNIGVPAYCTAPVIAPQLSNCPAVNSAVYGTITASGVYTAPATVPPVQPVIIAVSHGSSATTANAYITIN